MRDLQGIAEINGPRRAELQEERAANISAHSNVLPFITREAHGKRVAARHAQNKTPDAVQAAQGAR